MIADQSSGALRLLLQIVRAQDAGDPYAFRFAPQDYILPMEDGGSPAARFDWSPDVLDDLAATRQPGCDPAIALRIGDRLRRFIQDAGWIQYDHAITQAMADRRPIFVTIRSSAAELYALPWELLTLRTGQHLGTIDHLILRFEWPGTRSTVERPNPPLPGGRILVAWSAAGGTVPAADHIRAISAACAAGFHPFNPSTDVIAHASIARIVETLVAAQHSGQSIAILHLLCHASTVGSTSGLCLDGEDAPVVVDAGQLRQALGPFAYMVRLVVISGCDPGLSAWIPLHSVAQALHRCGMRSIVVFRNSASTSASTCLAEAFYLQLLARQTTLESAFLNARDNLLRRADPIDWLSLRLYSRHADGDETRPIVIRPYRGLLPFQLEHQRFFWGRERMIAEVLDDLQTLAHQKKRRFFAVCGSSGAGKSSFVLAGVVPKLLAAEPRLTFRSIRPGTEPNQALISALAQRPSDTSTLLVVDQFEEVFTQTQSKEARQAFARRLWELADDRESNICIIITLRLDFLDSCSELWVDDASLSLGRILDDEVHRIIVPMPWSESSLRAAIEEPARQVSLKLEPGLTDRLIEAAGHEPGAVPWLEATLDAVWQRRDGETLTQSAYNGLGGLSGMMLRTADNIIDTLPEDELVIARRLFTDLVLVAKDASLDARQRIAINDIRGAFPAAERLGCDRVLQRLISARLLTTDSEGVNAQVELAHIALIRKWPRLRQWIAQDRLHLVGHARIKQDTLEWEAHNRNDSFLYRGERLDDITEWRKIWEPRLGGLERSFLDTSDKLRQEEERRGGKRKRRLALLKEAPLSELLQFHRAKETSDPYAFYLEPQDYILPTASGESLSARFEWSSGIETELTALRAPGCDPELVQRIGRLLHRFIPEAVWDKLESVFAQADSTQRPVFLTIRSSAAELYSLPWELLTLKNNKHIGELDQLLIRYEWPGLKSATEQPRPRKEGGRILVAWSAAGGHVPAKEHIAAIAEACAAGFHTFDPDADVLAHASLNQIEKVLRDAQAGSRPIAVLHLLCHGARAGSTFGLALDGTAGRVVVNAAQIRKQLAPFASMVRLVVLCACDSANSGPLGSHLGSVAQTLHCAGFAAIVASRFPLSVSGSIILAQILYRQLLAGPVSLEAAFLVARGQLFRANADLEPELQNLDWASLQFYARHQDGDDSRPIIFRPFRGLLAFQPEHRRYFFGRETEVSEIVSDLNALIQEGKERFLVVAGASGTGKSSLVFAGAVPRLLAATPKLCLLRMRPGADPQAALAEILKQRKDDAPTLLIVDQFEEVFTQTEDPDTRTAFVRDLWGMAASKEPDIRIIVTLRVDFIGRCGEFVLNEAGLRLDTIAYDDPYRVFVAQIKPEQMRAIIEEPADLVGLELESGLTERILQEIGMEPGALPLLEDALDGLWQNREGRTLTQNAYTASGGVIGALKARADHCLKQLKKEDIPIARRLLVNLIAFADDTTLDTRLRVPVSDLRRCFSNTELPRFEQILHSLVAARLLVQDDDKTITWVEVAHEALIRKWDTLRDWIKEDRADLINERKVQQAARAWRQANRDDSLLYRGVQLAQAKDWRDKWGVRLADSEHFFLDKSEKAERKRKRLILLGLLLGALFFLLIAFLAVLAMTERNRATVERNQAEQVARLERGRRATLLAQQPAASFEALRLALRSLDPPVQSEVPFTENRSAPARAAPPVFEGLTSAAAHGGYPIFDSWPLAVTAPMNFPVPGISHASNLEGRTLVSFSPDGRQVVTISDNGTAQLWDVKSGAALLALGAPSEGVVAATFSPDGRQIVTARLDGTAQLWDAKTKVSFRTLKGHSSRLLAAGFSPDSSQVATAGADGTARLWDARTGAPLFILEGQRHEVRALSFSPDGSRLVTAGYEARLWDTKSGASLSTLQGHTNRVLVASFSPDGNRVVTFSAEKSAHLWDAKTGAALSVLQGGTPMAFVSRFSPDGSQVATAYYNGTVQLWDARTGGALLALKGHTDKVISADFSPDSRQIVTASADGTARLWNAKTGAFLFTLQGHSGGVLAASFSPDGSLVVTVSSDGTARRWDVKSGAPLLTLNGHTGMVFSASFSPDGTQVVTGSVDGTARVWNAKTGAALLAIQAHVNGVLSVSFSPDGTQLVTSSSDGTARIWSAKNGNPLFTLQSDPVGATIASFSPDGRQIVTASGDGITRLWSTERGASLFTLRRDNTSIFAASFSPDGTKVVTASRDGTAQVWDTRTGTSPFTLSGHTASVLTARFSPDSSKILTTSYDGSARLWDVRTGTCLLTLNGHARPSRAASFSPDGSKFITASDDGTARLWAVKGGACLSVLGGHTHMIRSADFSPDGSLVVTASEDGTAIVSDVATGSLLAKLVGHYGSVHTAAFSPDGNKIVTASEDGTAKIYATSVDHYARYACELLRGHPQEFRDVATICQRYFDGP